MNEAIQSTPRVNYFFRHWRGEIPLWVSFWINGVLLAIVSRFILDPVMYALAYALRNVLADQPTAPFIGASFLFVTWLIKALIFTWIIVGIWRSATNYSKISSIWGSAAKIAVILWAINFSVEMFLLISDYFRS